MTLGQWLLKGFNSLLKHVLGSHPLQWLRYKPELLDNDSCSVAAERVSSLLKHVLG